MMNFIYNNYQSSHPCHSRPKYYSPQDDRYFEANFFTFLPKDKNAHILDIGCGAGYFLQYLEFKGYTDYIGVDVSKEQIDFCKSKHLKGKVILISDLIKYLRANKNKFDFILMNDVIEHLQKEKIIDVLSYVHDSLVNDGVIVIKTANLKNRWGSSVRFMDFTHTTGFTEESLAQVLYLSGFRNQKQMTEIHPIYDVKSFVRVGLKSLLEIWYRLEYLASFGDFRVNLSNMLIVSANK